MNFEKTIVYEPDRALRIGFARQWREMIDDLLAGRELAWRLFVRDFVSRYKQSLFGIAWIAISPLTTVAIFVYLNSAGILRIRSTGVPYALFALLGLSIWNLFVGTMMSASGSLVSAAAMIGKINFPKISLIMAAALQALVDFLVRFGLVLLVFGVFRIWPSWKIIFIPLALFPLFALALGLGLFLALATAVIRDIGNAASLATSLLMFISPILYPPIKTGIATKITAVNPLAHLVNGPRDLVLYGNFSNLGGWLWSTVLAFLLFIFFWGVFHLAETRIAERI